MMPVRPRRIRGASRPFNPPAAVMKKSFLNRMTSPTLNRPPWPRVHGSCIDRLVIVVVAAAALIVVVVAGYVVVQRFDWAEKEHTPGVHVVRPTQAGCAAYGPPPPPASIQKILSARRPLSRAHEHATVRGLVRARAHPPHPITSKHPVPTCTARGKNVPYA